LFQKLEFGLLRLYLLFALRERRVSFREFTPRLTCVPHRTRDDPGLSFRRNRSTQRAFLLRRRRRHDPLEIPSLLVQLRR